MWFLAHMRKGGCKGQKANWQDLHVLAESETLAGIHALLSVQFAASRLFHEEMGSLARVICDSPRHPPSIVQMASSHSRRVPSQDMTIDPAHRHPNSVRVTAHQIVCFERQSIKFVRQNLPTIIMGHLNVFVHEWRMNTSDRHTLKTSRSSMTVIHLGFKILEFLECGSE
jgi:hypothetical protein